MAYFSPRKAETTLACPACGGKMEIRRSCLEVHMGCPSCGKDYPLKEFIGQSDKAMDDFLDNVYLDRI